MKTIYSLQPSSFCFWAEKSITMLTKIIQNHPDTPIYCVHALVHNPKVTKSFEAKGVHFVESLEEVTDPQAIIVFSAHGIDRNVLSKAHSEFKTVYNLECPFVTKIYNEVDMFIASGIRTFFYVGKENHQEGKNIISYVSSLGAKIYVIQNKEDIPHITETKIAVLSQTTLNFKYVQEVLQEIQKKYPNAEVPASLDVCKATYDRQSVILKNLDKFDTFIVIGGKESNNTKELYNIWIKNNKQTFYGESLADIVQTPNDKLFAYEKVAITGWASTPKEDIQEVIDFFVRNGYKEAVLTLIH